MPDTRGDHRIGRRLIRSAGSHLPAVLACLLPVCASFLTPGVAGAREAPAAEAGLSMDQAIAMTEKRYKARVVRASTDESGGQRVYVLRLLSEEGRVWTVRIDAVTGAEK